MKNLFTYLSFILVSSTVLGQTCIPNDTTFNTQADIDNFLINNPTCTTIEGNLMITGNDITNLHGLQNITTFTNGIWIENCPLLANFSGLENVSYIGDYLEIGDLALIKNFDELSNLTFVGGPLDVLFLPVLVSLDSLVNITSAPTHLIIWGNPSLTNLNGLNNIQSVSILLRIQSNTLLNDISSVDNFDLSSVTEISIQANPLLSVCNQKSICDALNNGVTIFTIQNNKIGCSTVAEIESSCEPNSVQELRNDDFNFYPNPAKTELVFNSDGIKTVKIFSQTGQLLLLQQNATTILNVSNLNPGLYFITVEYANGIQTKKLIIGRK